MLIAFTITSLAEHRRKGLVRNTLDHMVKAFSWGYSAFLVVLSDVESPESLSGLDRLRERAGEFGIRLITGFGAPDALLDSDRRWEVDRKFRFASEVGSPVLGLAINPPFERYQIPWTPDFTRSRMDLAIRIGRAAASWAERYGVKVVMENHVDFQVDEIEEILGSVDSPGFGLRYDTGNQLLLGEDPVASARRLAPWIEELHLKDLFARPERRGLRLFWSPLGKGAVDFSALAEVLGERVADLPMTVEHYTSAARPCLPIASDVYWEGMNMARNTDLPGFRLLASKADQQLLPVSGEEGALQAEEQVAHGNLAFVKQVFGSG